ncbi:sigma-70 family RNA polymerase sigma factor [Microbacterium testaceum]|uniref:Sigma-70 family RNA polymerase sigma factor n=2 Tax=Microbacterium testaceum TaxID=2033 RepID=A0A2T7WLD0_MICTE|nr:sigma-70 family RNA polymerase sigma factor [Microbacterium testaceum]
MSTGMTAEEWAATVVDANGPDLLRYFIRRAATEHHDLLSETFVVIWRRREHLPREAVAARMWSFGVARNVLHHHHRRRRMANLTVERVAREVQDGASEDPAEASEATERREAIRAALRTLSERNRELIILVHWDGFSIVDAASLLRINPSTARTRYERAKRHLAAELSSYGTIAVDD